jgi:hypothetical protein
MGPTCLARREEDVYIFDASTRSRSVSSSVTCTSGCGCLLPRALLAAAGLPNPLPAAARAPLLRLTHLLHRLAAAHDGTAAGEGCRQQGVAARRQCMASDSRRRGCREQELQRAEAPYYLQDYYFLGMGTPAKGSFAAAAQPAP